MVRMEIIYIAEKARKELNGEILIPITSKDRTGRPVRICKYEGKSEINDTKDINKSLLVKNIDKDITAKDFYKIFEEFGDIKSLKLEVDEMGHSKGFGYVYYTDSKSADKAIKTMVIIFYKSEW
jgi:RNA recognition motif-containing protein